MFYRTPTKLVHSSIPTGDSPALDQAQEGTRVVLEPTDAMRIWRPRGSRYVVFLLPATPHRSLSHLSSPRYLSLLYKSEARDFDMTQANDAAAKAGEQHQDNGRESTISDAFSGSGLFIDPLKYDEEVRNVLCTLCFMCSYVADSSCVIGIDDSHDRFCVWAS